MWLAFLAAALPFRRRADPTRLDDQALIRAALGGDSAAGRTLVDRAAPAIRARVLRHVRGRRLAGLDVDDLTHEVWCRLLAGDAKRLRAYDPTRGKTFGGYLSLIAGQLISNVVEQHRAVKRSAPGGETNLEDARAVSEKAPSPEAIAGRRQELRALFTHLEGELPPRGRVVLHLLYSDGLSVDEAAGRMGAKRQVVYNWQHRIRKLARAHAQEKEAGEDAVGPGERQ